MKATHWLLIAILIPLSPCKALETNTLALQPGDSVRQVVETMRADGFAIAYNTELLPAHLTVIEVPEAQTPLAQLQAILKAHGLTLIEVGELAIISPVEPPTKDNNSGAIMLVVQDEKPANRSPLSSCRIHLPIGNPQPMDQVDCGCRHCRLATTNCTSQRQAILRPHKLFKYVNNSGLPWCRYSLSRRFFAPRISRCRAVDMKSCGKHYRRQALSVRQVCRTILVSAMTRCGRYIACQGSPPAAILCGRIFAAVNSLIPELSSTVSGCWIRFTSGTIKTYSVP